MSENTTQTPQNPAALRQLGIEALTKALGPVGMARFMRQFAMGGGNYTRERETREPVGLKTPPAKSPVFSKGKAQGNNWAKAY